MLCIYIYVVYVLSLDITDMDNMLFMPGGTFEVLQSEKKKLCPCCRRQIQMTTRGRWASRSSVPSTRWCRPAGICTSSCSPTATSKITSTQMTWPASWRLNKRYTQTQHMSYSISTKIDTPSIERCSHSALDGQFRFRLTKPGAYITQTKWNGQSALQRKSLVTLYAKTARHKNSFPQAWWTMNIAHFYHRIRQPIDSLFISAASW